MHIERVSILRFKGESLTHRDVCLRKDLYYPSDFEK